MRKRTIGILYVISIVMGLIGAGLVIAGLAGSTFVTTSTPTSVHSQVAVLGNPALFVIGVIVAVLAGIPHLIAWIGALVNLARLQQWVWFILMILFSSICLLVYLIMGPETPSVPRYPQYAPRADQPPADNLS
jgi:hypothetical protein